MNTTGDDAVITDHNKDSSDGTWRRGSEPVAGLVLPSLLMGLGAEIPLAEVLLQLAQALGGRQIHKTVQEVPVLGPRRAHPASQVSADIIYATCSVFLNTKVGRLAFIHHRQDLRVPADRCRSTI